MPVQTAAKNLMLDALGGTNPTTPITHFSLHTADPGGTGTSEVTGGSPAYARKAVTWAAASGGSKAINGTMPVFDVPACTVAWVGAWSAITSGTWLASFDVTDEVFAGQGTYTVTSASISLT